MTKPQYPLFATEWVDETTIRSHFNTQAVWESVRTGTRIMSVRLTRPAPPEDRSGQPEGTLSQLIDIFEHDGTFVASAHRYLRPGEDPAFGGRPDPKRLVVNGKMLALRAQPPAIVDQGDGHVLVGQRRIWGFIQSFKTTCGHSNIYAERYDAHFCPIDNVWLEKHCDDPACQFCSNRPSRPLDADLDEPSGDNPPKWNTPPK